MQHSLRILPAILLSTFLFAQGICVAVAQEIEAGFVEQTIQVPFLVSEPKDIHVGEEFVVRIEHVPEGVTAYGWDLHTNGIEDAKTDVQELRLAPDAPGILPMRVIMKDKSGIAIQTISHEFEVLPRQALPSDDTTSVPLQNDLEIIAEIQGDIVHFSLAITAPVNLSRLQPEWLFGDGSRSFLLEPIHTYTNANTYRVGVVLKDLGTDTVIKSAEAMVIIKGSAVPVDAGGDNGPGVFSGVLSVIKKIASFIFKVIFLVVILLLILLCVAGGYILFVAQTKHVSFMDAVAKSQKKLMVLFGKEVKEKEQEDPLLPEVIETTEGTVDAVSQIIHSEIVEGKREEAPVELVSEVVEKSEESTVKNEESGQENEVVVSETVIEQPIHEPSEAPEVSHAIPEPAESVQNSEGAVPAWLQQGESVERKEKNEEINKGENDTSAGLRPTGGQEESGQVVSGQSSETVNQSAPSETVQTEVVETPPPSTITEPPVAPATPQMPSTVESPTPEPVSQPQPETQSPDGPVPAWLQQEEDESEKSTVKNEAVASETVDSGSVVGGTENAAASSESVQAEVVETPPSAVTESPVAVEVPQEPPVAESSMSEPVSQPVMPTDLSPEASAKEDPAIQQPQLQPKFGEDDDETIAIVKAEGVEEKSLPTQGEIKPVPKVDSSEEDANTAI